MADSCVLSVGTVYKEVFVVALSHKMKNKGSIPRGANNASSAWLIPSISKNMELHVLNIGK
jgi:hypothetical protein